MYQYFYFSFLNFFERFYVFIFRDRGREGKEKERERNIIVWLPVMCPHLGTWPATQACALTGNRTGNPLVCRPVLSPLSYTMQSLNISISQQQRMLAVPSALGYLLFLLLYFALLAIRMFWGRKKNWEVDCNPHSS